MEPKDVYLLLLSLFLLFCIHRENMKVQHEKSSDSSSRTIGEKLAQAYRDVKVALALTKNRGVGMRRNQKEDPIRTIMFLGSWSHT